MFRSIYDYVRDNTIHLTGAIRHCSYWFTSGSFIANPNFNPDTLEPVSIYCVHGTADSGGAFGLTATRLLEGMSQHIRGVYLIDLEKRFEGNSIEDFAKQLKDRIKENKDENVMLMGHSRGALICAFFTVYLAEINKINVVAPVISLCGPFRGSYLAIGPIKSLSNSVKEMAKDSEFLINLSANMQKSSAKFCFIGTNKDWVVSSDCWFPYYIDSEEHADCMLLDRHGHLSVMSSHRLIDRVKSLWFSAPRCIEELDEVDGSVARNSM